MGYWGTNDLYLITILWLRFVNFQTITDQSSQFLIVTFCLTHIFLRVVVVRNNRLTISFIATIFERWLLWAVFYEILKNKRLSTAASSATKKRSASHVNFFFVGIAFLFNRSHKHFFALFVNDNKWIECQFFRLSFFRNLIQCFVFNHEPASFFASLHSKIHSLFSLIFLLFFLFLSFFQNEIERLLFKNG